METGLVTLAESVVAPAIVIGTEGGDMVALWVFVQTGPFRYIATRGTEPGVGIFVAD